MKRENYIGQLLHKKSKDEFFITETRNGYRYWYRISVNDLLDDGFSADDLKGVVVNTIYMIESGGFKPF